MKIWYDACTGKHIRYGAAIAKRLRKHGHEVIFTTREHPDTLALARIIGENPIVVGRYMRPGGKYAHVRREYERLMVEAKKKFELTHDKAVEDLYKLRDDAWAQGNFTAAINAQNLLLKVGGLIVDRREVLHGKVDQMSRDEVEKRLAQLLGTKALEQKSGTVIEDKSGSRD